MVPHIFRCSADSADIYPSTDKTDCKVNCLKPLANTYQTIMTFANVAIDTCDMICFCTIKEGPIVTEASENGNSVQHDLYTQELR